jgi:hypothetical protein
MLKRLFVGQDPLISINSNTEEISLHLQATRARRDVHLAERQLALSRFQEICVRLRVERVRFEKADERLEVAELEVGRARLLARRKRQMDCQKSLRRRSTALEGM